MQRPTEWPRLMPWSASLSKAGLISLKWRERSTNRPGPCAVSKDGSRMAGWPRWDAPMAIRLDGRACPWRGKSWLTNSKPMATPTQLRDRPATWRQRDSRPKAPAPFGLERFLHPIPIALGADPELEPKPVRFGCTGRFPDAGQASGELEPKPVRFFFCHDFSTQRGYRSG